MDVEEGAEEEGRGGLARVAGDAIWDAGGERSELLRGLGGKKRTREINQLTLSLTRTKATGSMTRAGAGFSGTFAASAAALAALEGRAIF